MTKLLEHAIERLRQLPEDMQDTVARGVMAQLATTAEDVAYWYLRLNGFLLLRNFLVHGDRRGRTRTDIDILGVRFRYRREHLADPMQDDDWIEQANRTIVVFCDAKKGAQDFNPAWFNANQQVMESFLALVGIISESLWKQVSADLYTRGQSKTDPNLLVTTLLMHYDPNKRVNSRWHGAQVIQLDYALRFIHRRFEAYRSVKMDHAQWEPSGHCLWNLYERHRRSEDGFIAAGLKEIGCNYENRDMRRDDKR